MDEDGTVTKADMFTKQTIKAKESIESVETAVEALNISINEFNGVNIPFMLSIYEPDISGMKKRRQQRRMRKGGKPPGRRYQRRISYFLKS